MVVQDHILNTMMKSACGPPSTVAKQNSTLHAERTSLLSDMQRLVERVQKQEETMKLQKIQLEGLRGYIRQMRAERAQFIQDIQSRDMIQAKCDKFADTIELLKKKLENERMASRAIIAEKDNRCIF